MKKLLLIALLIVGCDNSTESSVHPIIGIWEWSNTTNTTQDYHQGSIVEIITENTFNIYKFNQDGTYNPSNSISDSDGANSS